jgi:hypothetical protein
LRFVHRDFTTPMANITSSDRTIEPQMAVPTGRAFFFVQHDAGS